MRVVRLSDEHRCSSARWKSLQNAQEGVLQGVFVGRAGPCNFQDASEGPLAIRKALEGRTMIQCHAPSSGYCPRRATPDVLSST